MTSSLPLAGLKVTEIGHSVAGPFAGAVLAQLGAEVVKIETPELGDPARGWGPPYHGSTAVVFDVLNRDKRSIAADLKDPAWARAVRGHVLGRDAVIQNLRPGATERLGLGAAELTAARPSLIYCNLSAFGQRGPMRGRPGYDSLMQAYAGLMSMTGEEGGGPVRVGASVVDMGAGMWAAIGILAALRERERTGIGGIVDTSLFETTLAWLTIPLATFLASGEVSGRLGTAAAQIVPYQGFATADGYLMIGAGTDGLFRRLAEALGRPGWPDDPRFVTNGARVRNRAVLVPQIAAIVASAPTAAWIAKLDAAGVPCAKQQSLDDVVTDPQTMALEMIQHDRAGARRFVGLPVSFNGARPPLRLGSPALGEHNDALGVPAREPGES